MIVMAFIFFPVSRGSVLLRLVNIPFEHAVKYHKWMASIMMVIVVAHGGIYLVLWQSLDRFWQEVRLRIMRARKLHVRSTCLSTDPWMFCSRGDVHVDSFASGTYMYCKNNETLVESWFSCDVSL